MVTARVSGIRSWPRSSDAPRPDVVRSALADPDGDGFYTATFFFVDPRLGPFSVRLVAPDGVTFTADPMQATVDVGSGESMEVVIFVTSVREN